MEKAVAAAVLAGIIASVIPKIGPVTVIAKIGLSALSVVASMCVNGHVKCASYVHVMPDASVRLNVTGRLRLQKAKVMVHLVHIINE